MFGRILIATDGSELSDKAVDQGLALAKSVGAKVTISGPDKQLLGQTVLTFGRGGTTSCTFFWALVKVPAGHGEYLITAGEQHVFEVTEDQLTAEGGLDLELVVNR